MNSLGQWLAQWLTANPQIPVFVVSAAMVVLMIIVIIYVVAFFQGREISLGALKISSRPPLATKPRPSHPVIPAPSTPVPGALMPNRLASDLRRFPSDRLLSHFVPVIDPRRFQIVVLPQLPAPSTYGDPFAPAGFMVLYDIPFLLQPAAGMGHNLLADLQPSLEGAPRSIRLTVEAEQLAKIHVLLSAGHGYQSLQGVTFAGKRIGYIELGFTTGSPQRADIILGRNIREWIIGKPAQEQGDFVRNIDPACARPAWLAQDHSHMLDLWTIVVAGGVRDLTSIRIVAEFEELHVGIMTPAVRISAMTCERAE